MTAGGTARRLDSGSRGPTRVARQRVSRTVMDEQARESASMSALVTEHFVLQSAASTTISEASARASLYVFSLSSALVAIPYVEPGGVDLLRSLASQRRGGGRGAGHAWHQAPMDHGPAHHGQHGRDHQQPVGAVGVARWLPRCSTHRMCFRSWWTPRRPWSLSPPRTPIDVSPLRGGRCKSAAASIRPCMTASSSPFARRRPSSARASPCATAQAAASA